VIVSQDRQAELLAHMLGDEPLPPDDIKGFGDILTNLRELGAAACSVPNRLAGHAVDRSGALA